MLKVVCPECAAEREFQQGELSLHNQIKCAMCGVLLEVVEEDPLEVEIVDEYLSPSDDDDYDADDEDDDS
jgi:lysine biosynthesis protein LysW